jgi:hypothetical protein
MGYDLWVRAGRLIPDKGAELAHRLSSVAQHMELAWSSVDLLFTGDIAYTEFDRAYGAGDASGSLVPSRAWVPANDKFDEILGTQSYQARVLEERIQGLVIHHPYADWTFCWNTTHGHVLSSYELDPMPRDIPRNSTTLPVRRHAGALTHREAAALFDQDPVMLTGGLTERRIHVETPWRESDVIAAVDVFRQLQACCTGFALHDDYGVWANGMAAWRNPLKNWVDTIGGQPAHPDAADQLRENPQEEHPRTQQDP